MLDFLVKHGLRQGSPGRVGGRGTGALFVAAAAAVALVLSAQAAAKPGAPIAASIVAQGLGKHVAVYRTPGAPRPSLVLSNPTADGGPLVFLVKSRRPGWEQVLLARRPNGSTGWVKDSAVSLALDPYSVSVSLHRRRIVVRNGNRVILSAPAGVGRSVLPTPTGRYYIVDLLKQADPQGPYGPYAFGLSAFSNVLYSFGGGPGQIGLHGTDEPSLLGTDVSHGCIRVGNPVITRLAGTLPLGTPVVIVP
jgi:lipoprotein-anchoring transpeptidase ErfK/SrfK